MTALRWALLLAALHRFSGAVILGGIGAGFLAGQIRRRHAGSIGEAV